MLEMELARQEQSLAAYVDCRIGALRVSSKKYSILLYFISSTAA